MMTNNTMKKAVSTAKYFIQVHDLEARIDIWADGTYVRAFEKGSPEFYWDSFGDKSMIPRRMDVQEFNILAANGYILTKDEVKSLEKTYNARSVYYKFIF